MWLVAALGVMIVPVLTSLWHPWNHLGLKIETMLVPLAEKFPGWHMRIHKVIWDSSGGMEPWVDIIRIVDGGFALDEETGSGRFIPQMQLSSTDTEGWSKDMTSCLLKSHAGVSGIFDFNTLDGIPVNREKVKSQCFALKPDPNTNLIASRTLIPVIQHEIPVTCFRNEGQSPNSAKGLCLVSGVFAVAASAGLSQGVIHDMWLNKPQLRVDIDQRDFAIRVL